jgi:SAM-dependent methyltransferase
MLDSYEDIFTERGDAYHEAMTRWPQAREEELRLLLDELAPQPGETLVDAPAGGGYLASRVPAGVRYVAVEAARPFFERCPEGNHCSRVLSPLAKIGLPDGCADVVTCLTGLHHEPDVSGSLSEMVRILRPGGRLGIADVELGSPPDRFLNVFVHEHSRTGHRGVFFNAAFADELREAGLAEVKIAFRPLRWCFADAAAMPAFVRLLFGVDLASEVEILAAISEVLGTDALPRGGVAMRWGLLVATGRKPG